MTHIAKKDEKLWVYSMGKRFQITAIFTDLDESNAYMAMANHRDESVIACFGPFIFLADRYMDVTV